MNAEALCGKVLGTCTLQKIIGRGGMGAVYLAQQSRPKRQVAVKVLLPITTFEPQQHAAFLERFRRETDAAASLQHLNIMPVHEYGEREGLAYLVMPYISGGTLRDELDTEGRLPLTRIVMYLEQIADALDFAHSQGVIHRDIKPANIMMTPEKRLLLTDFGLVKIITDDQNAQKPLSEVGAPMGTPDYMAPEQVVGGVIDARTDIYSLGVLLYHMLTGTVPFTGDIPMKVAMQHLHAPPPVPRSLRPDLPIAAEKTILRALAKRPADRYAHARELASAFRLALEAAGVQVGDIQPAPNDDRSIGNRPRSLFDPVWRSNMETPAIGSDLSLNEPFLGSYPVVPAPAHKKTAQQVHSTNDNDIVAQTKMAMVSLTDILTQEHLPIVVPTQSAQPVAAGLAGNEALLPAKKEIEASKATVTARPAHLTLLAATAMPNDQGKSFTAVKHIPLSSVRDMNNQQGPTNSANNQSWPPNKKQEGAAPSARNSILGPHFRSGHKTSLHNWQQGNATQAPLGQPDNSAVQSYQNSPIAPNSPANPYEATVSFNTASPQQDFAAPTTPFNPLQSGTKPLGSSPAQPNHEQSWKSPQQQDFTQPPNGNQAQQPGNVTMQLVPTTGMLPNPNATGTLAHPAGEYSGETGMLKLHQPVKVVRVPVAGQPGQYRTGILPVQSTTQTGALPSPSQTQEDTTLTGKLKRHGKIVILAAIVLLILFSSGIYLLASSSSAPSSTANTSDKPTDAKGATATAQVNATATADVNNVIMEDQLTSNAFGWLISDKDGRKFFFKDGAYHIRQDKEYLAQAYHLNASLKGSPKFTYTLTMRQIEGDNTSDQNYFAMMLHYNQSDDGNNVTFYAFKLVNNKNKRHYIFDKYDSAKAPTYWSDPIFSKDAGNEFKDGKVPNTVKIVVDHDHFTFFVNGKQVGDTHDSSLKDGFAGMLVNKDPAKASNETAFTNFLLVKN